jgi:predicted phosphodiesterase
MLAILSDIHANLAALEAVLEDARSRGCNDFICLGDVIGYNGEPEECCQLLMQKWDSQHSGQS